MWYLTRATGIVASLLADWQLITTDAFNAYRVS